MTSRTLSNSSHQNHPPHFDYVRSMERLLTALQELSLARDLDTIQKVVRTAARDLTGCDGATFVLREDDNCHYVDEDAMAPLWKGSRFPLNTCVSGWTMLNKTAAVIPHVYADSRIPQDVYMPTFVQSLVMVPIRSHAPVGAIGSYWAHQHHASTEEVQLLQTLADSTAIAIENVQLYASLEQRVQERTTELQKANEDIQKLSMTDELTGLYNRRGFYLLARQALQQAARRNSDCALAFVDLDGLKHVNDVYGHEAGDALLADAATVLDQAFREADIVARMGGDEFCVLALEPGDVDFLRQRVQEGFEAFNHSSEKPYQLSASIGIAYSPAAEADLGQLLGQADQLMYSQKKTRSKKHSPPPHV